VEPFAGEEQRMHLSLRFFPFVPQGQNDDGALARKKLSAGPSFG
jgi:hypothetical protein